MSYYVEPDYWEYGYAVGDAVTGSASIPISVSTTATGVFLVDGNVTISFPNAVVTVGTRVREGSALIAANLSASAVGGYSLDGQRKYRRAFSDFSFSKPSNRWRSRCLNSRFYVYYWKC
jgi:hypothetical protein